MANPNDREYTNGEITVYWRPSECIHATTCFVKLRSVFNPGKRPWVNMQGAPTQDIIDIVNECPTDALTFKWNKDIDSSAQPVKPAAAKALRIKVLKDGPLVCEGNYILSDEKGTIYSTYALTPLCRCAHSKRQPYCDGKHRAAGFTDNQNE